MVSVPRRLIVSMTGATGAVFGVELLRRLRAEPDVETHLVLSRWARATIHLETHLSVREVADLADVTYSWNDQGAAIASGSFPVAAMIIVPCSMKTLAGIRTGYADGLIARAAEVVAILRDADLPITTAWMPLGAACHWMVVTVPGNWRDLLPGVDTAGFAHRIGEALSPTRAGRNCPVTYVLDDDVDPSNDSDLLWALGTRVHPVSRQEHWEGPIMPWYECYLEDERHNGRGATAVHDGLLPADRRKVPSATFDAVYPADIRTRVLAAERNRKTSPDGQRLAHVRGQAAAEGHDHPS